MTPAPIVPTRLKYVTRPVTGALFMETFDCASIAPALPAMAQSTLALQKQAGDNFIDRR